MDMNDFTERAEQIAVDAVPLLCKQIVLFQTEIDRLRAALARIGGPDQRIEDRDLWIFEAMKLANETLNPETKE